jgi:ketosteroid isomerase-like protein
MLAPDPKLVTLLFNDAINARDLERLVARMTDDHRFIDTENNVVEGRAAAERAWRGFFDSFPDYRNHFETLTHRGERVFVVGHSTCSFAALEGTAIWTAVIRADRVAEWRVYPDDDAIRRALGLREGSALTLNT